MASRAIVGELERAGLEAFVRDGQTVAIPVENLEAVAALHDVNADSLTERVLALFARGRVTDANDAS